MKIWERYFFLETFKFFLFFLFSFYFLYSILDYSTHMQDFVKGSSLNLTKLLTYYGYHFIKRMPLLLPLAFIISMIKVLTQANMRNELLALQIAGIKQKSILRPFFCLSLLLCFCNFVVFETVTPKALNYIDQFHAAYLKHSKSKTKGKEEPIHVLYLDDGSKLVYQNYNASDHSFFDVFFVIHADDLWRIKTLSWEGDLMIGHFVDHLTREEGLFVKKESFDSYPFQNIKLQKEKTLTRLSALENRSISELLRLKNSEDPRYRDEKGAIRTLLYFKAMIPLLPLLAVFAISPFCFRFSRSFSFFFLYAFSLLGFIVFLTLMNAAIILGKNEVFPPSVAIIAPFLFLFIGFTWNFRRAVA